VSPTASASWPAEAGSVPQARALVRRHLAQAADAGPLRDDAELLVTELVANVVLHVGGTVTVTVTTAPHEVLIEVGDDSPVVPTAGCSRRRPAPGAGCACSLRCPRRTG
jgi:anti-sigma regulatory factor (Ser/Thr protein kinase)